MKKTAPVAPIPTPAVALSPTSAVAQLAFDHWDIARHAEALWREKGCPQGCDYAIWLEAERQLASGKRSIREDRDEKAFANPRFLFNQGTGGMMDELNARFPGPTGRETTSL